tara:strand:+ start:314 stop:823 length:510 start_codon:yes stop_codon:yes gene_type:complete
MSFLTKRIQQILVQAAENIINAARKNLEDGDLKNSLRYNDKNGTIEVIMEDYGVFQDRGVTGRGSSDFKGKKKKVHKSLDGFKFKSKVIGGSENIDKWMYKKGIQGRDKKGRFIKRKTTNFLIRRSIAQHGIKPSLFLTTPYKKYSEQIIQEFNNLQGDIIKDINGTDR